MPLRFAHVATLWLSASASLALAADEPAKGKPNTADFRAARLIPAEKIAGYVEYQGVEDHAAAWRETTAFDILNKTPVGALIDDLSAQTIEHLIKKSIGKNETPSAVAKQLVAFRSFVARRGFAFAWRDDDDNDPGFKFLVLRDAARADVRESCERTFRLIAAARGFELSPPILVRGRSIQEAREDLVKLVDRLSLKDRGVAKFLKNKYKIEDKNAAEPIFAWWFDGPDAVVVFQAELDLLDAYLLERLPKLIGPSGLANGPRARRSTRRTEKRRAL